MGVILRSARVWGTRSYRGEVVRRDCWPAIIDEVTAARVRFALADRSRRPQARADYLLNDLVVCDACGRTMRATVYAHSGPAYRCGIGRGGRHSAIVAGRFETWLTDAVLERIAWREAHPVESIALGARGEARRQAEELTGHARELERVAALYASGEVPAAVFHGTRRALARSIDEVHHGGRPNWRRDALAGRTAAQLREAWAAMPLADRREVIRSELDHARIAASRGGVTFDSRRVIPVWWERLPLRPSPLIIRGTGPDKDPGRPPHLMSSGDVAAFLGVSIAVVQRAVHRGALPATRGECHPFAFRFARTDVVDYLQRLAVQPQAASPAGTPTRATLRRAPPATDSSTARPR